MDGTDRKELGLVCAPRLRYCTTVAKKSDGRNDARPGRRRVEHISFELGGRRRADGIDKTVCKKVENVPSFCEGVVWPEQLSKALLAQPHIRNGLYGCRSRRHGHTCDRETR